MSDTKAPTKTYKASCHCGAFKYDVTTASLDDASTEVSRCNCSICTRNGYLLIYVPNDQIVFEKGGIEDFKVACPHYKHNTGSVTSHPTLKAFLLMRPSLIPFPPTASRTTSVLHVVAHAWQGALGPAFSMERASSMFGCSREWSRRS